MHELARLSDSNCRVFIQTRYRWLIQQEQARLESQEQEPGERGETVLHVSWPTPRSEATIDGPDVDSGQ